MPLGRLLIQFFHGSGENQPLLRPGQRHIQHPQLLSQALQFQLLLDHLAHQGRRLDPQSRPDGIASHAQIRMNHQTGIGVGHVESLAQPGHKYHRKFQTLAFVDTHNPNRILIFPDGTHLSEIHLVFLKIFDIADEIEKPPVAGFLKLHGLFLQHFQIGLPLLSPRHSLGIQAVAGLLEDQVNQLVDGRIRHPPAYPAVNREKPLQLFSKLVIRPFPAVALRRQIHLLSGKFSPDPGQFLRTEAPHGGSQHGGEGNLLHGIVADMEIIQHRHHFQRAEISGFRGAVGGNSHIHQHPHKDVRPAGDGPKKHHAVPVAGRPVFPGLLVQHRHPAHHAADFLPHSPGLQLLGRKLRGVVLRLRNIQLCQQHLDTLRLLPLFHGRKGRAGIQSRRLVVFHTAQLFPHNLPENKVDPGKHLGAASEIPVQIDPLAGPVLQRVRLVFFHEQLRPGQPEPVDALLHISHHENVVNPPADPGHTGKKRLLHQIAVLVFVDEDFLKPVGKFLGRLRVLKTAVLPPLHQDFQGKMLHV